ncbi:MAG: two-component regulator propeller domain-containing protein [Verrucomicrobiota bacterium]
MIAVIVGMSLEPLHALDPSKVLTQYHQDVWTERQGLPQGSVQALWQTSDGYLWIGTRDGLARFDGVNFSVFRSETHEGLDSNDIRALCEDRFQRLWIGTFNGGLSCYAKGKLIRYSTEDGLPSNGILDLRVDRNGVVWISTWTGLARFENGRFRAIGNEDGQPLLTASSIREDSEGRLWIASESSLYQIKGDRFVPVNLNGWPENPIREIYPDRDGSLWICTLGSGMGRLKEGQLTRFTIEDGLPDNKIRTALRDRNGNLFLGTWSGLCRSRNGKFRTYSRADGLPHDIVETLYEDREGSLWIGTRGAGLVRFRDGKFSNFTTREGLAHNFAKCVLEDRQGAIWVGSHGGGLSRYKDGQFTTYNTAHGLPSPFVWSIGEDYEGNIWVGTGRPGSLSRFQEGRFVAFQNEQTLPIERGVRALLADRDGNLWIGVDGGGLGCLRDGTLTWYTTNHGLPSNVIRVIYQDRENQLWIGTIHGLCRIRDGQFTSFNTDDGLAHNAVYTVFEDSEGMIWIGTQGGLSRYAEGRFHSYTTRDGLMQNFVYQILEDNRQHLWMSSNRGVFRVSKQAFADFDRGQARTLVCEPYGISDGMKTTQCEGGSQPAGWKSRDGRLWFPTAHGVTMLDPEQLFRNLQPPPVVIEAVSLPDRTVALPGPVQLQPNTREIRIHYTALSFLAPEKVQFRYRLEGLSSDWIEAGPRREATYHELPPGKYRFQVVACNNDGVWNETGAIFSFSLPPRFYQTAWFYALCALILILAGWEYHRRRLRQAEAQFSVVLAERNRIARDLHDTLAQGFAGIAFQLEAVATKLTEAPAQAQEHLTIALNMVRHSLAEARRTVMNLRSAALENGDLATALNESGRQILAGRPVQLDVKTQGEPRPIPAKTEENLLRIGQEAITNALKHAEATRIDVLLEYRPESVCLIVRDDGKGFDPVTEQNRNGAHFGLLGMRERAKQVNGQLRIQSDPQTRGTKIVFEISTR